MDNHPGCGQLGAQEEAAPAEPEDDEKDPALSDFFADPEEPEFEEPELEDPEPEEPDDDEPDEPEPESAEPPDPEDDPASPLDFSLDLVPCDSPDLPSPDPSGFARLSVR